METRPGTLAMVHPDDLMLPNHVPKAPPVLYDGLETNRALSRAAPPPPHRRALISRPDLDELATNAAAARYTASLDEQARARALLAMGRRAQRGLFARQAAEVRALEARVCVPHHVKRERAAREAARASEAARLAAPRFEDTDGAARALAEAMAIARGALGQSSGLHASSSRPTADGAARGWRAALVADASTLVQLAPKCATPVSNALAVARVHERRLADGARARVPAGGPLGASG